MQPHAIRKCDERTPRVCAYCNEVFQALVSELKRGNSRCCSKSCAIKLNHREFPRTYRTIPLAERFWEKVDFNGPIPTHRPEIGPCWIWMAARSQKARTGEASYGQINVNGRREGAHRIAWLLVYGSIPEGQDICHRCDYSPCVRPAHLFPDSRKGNVDDMITKGRRPTKFLRLPCDIVTRLIALVGSDGDGLRSYALKLLEESLVLAEAQGQRIIKEKLALPRAASHNGKGQCFGARNGSTRLTPEAVREIREKHTRGGITVRALGAEYGVSPFTIDSVIYRKSWKYID